MKKKNIILSKHSKSSDFVFNNKILNSSPQIDIYKNNIVLRIVLKVL
jgi:hypothetical protein